MTDPVRCSAIVSDRTSRWPRNYGCSRTMKVMRDGKPYCNQHDPEKVAAKRAAWEAKYQAKERALLQVRDAAEKLATELGIGRPEYSGGYTGGIVLSAEEAQRVIGWLETLRKAQCKNG